MGYRVWPVLVLLALVVLAPTAALTWLVGRAAENERLASRERLRQAHDATLRGAARELDDYFRSLSRRVDELGVERAGGRLFGEALRLDLADAIVCLNDRGEITYPPASPTPEADLLAGVQAWSDAERLERAARPVEAAEAFAEIAAAGQHPTIVARARLAHARCLAQSGDDERALAVLAEIQDAPGSAIHRDPFGRLVVVDAGLLALLLMERRDEKIEGSTVARRLLAWGGDYELDMPAAQRRFLGGQLEKRFPADPSMNWLAAERLAAEIADARNPRLPAGDRWLAWRGDDGQRVYGEVTSARKAILLFGETSIRQRAKRRLAGLEKQPGVNFKLLAAGESHAAGDGAIELENPAGWRLQLADAAMDDPDALAESRIDLYGWATALTIGAVLAAATLVGGLIGRQQRVSRQQNDWLASVSHELKTPLASIRLLTETLQDEEAVDRREYLQMIGQETARLTRLIDGMLAFSRAERPSSGIDRRPTPPAEIAERAAQLLADRLNAPGCRFTRRIEAELPPVDVDRDAMIAVLVNLLDNAWKFTSADKEIDLLVERCDERVCFRVKDNGIGLAPRDARRIFRRFFQVDRRLSRERQGCGLGLALAQLVVRAHGGEVRVESELGKGSTFSVVLPVSPIGSRGNGGKQKTNGKLKM